MVARPDNEWDVLQHVSPGQAEESKDYNKVP